MSALIRDVTYALRSFRSARVFAATAVLTLALGIGGTTAIFTLMHAVMLKSLPVADPSRLYRIGDGDNCCVQGSPQGRWGFYSFPLFERIKAETPQFEDITAFPTFVGRMSVRRQGVAEAPRPLRTMYATGSYFTTLGVGAFTGRVFTAADDRAAATARGGDGLPRLAGSLRRRRLGRGFHADDRRPRVHGRRDRAAGILRRDPARRPARPLASAAARDRSSPAPTRRCCASACRHGCA